MALEPRPFDPPQKPYTGKFASQLPDPKAPGPFDYQHAFPQFYFNETIMRLSPKPRWTISTNFKAPININHYKARGVISGAVISEMNSHLTTLDDVMATIPNAANCCFFLDTVLDDIIILDIESSCDVETRNQLLQTLPYALYAETSMSGKGYHIVLPKPKNFDDYPLATGKNKIQHDSGSYEILISHWVTFTRNTIDESLIDAALSNPETLTPEQLWESLAPQAQQNAEKKIDVAFDYDTGVELTDQEEKMVRSIVDIYHKSNTVTPEKFNFDMSKFEFSRIGNIANITFDYLNDINAAKKIEPSKKMSISQYKKEKARGYQGEADVELLIKLTHAAVCEVFEPRAKHAETRAGMPYLLYRVISNIETTDWTDRLTQRAVKALENVPASTPATSEYQPNPETSGNTSPHTPKPPVN
jgi:hypothetical protein